MELGCFAADIVVKDSNLEELLAQASRSVPEKGQRGSPPTGHRSSRPADETYWEPRE